MIKTINNRCESFEDFLIATAPAWLNTAKFSISIVVGVWFAAFYLTQ